MRVFISYATEDGDYVRALSEALARRGIEVIGGESITPGSNWATSLQRRLEAANAFVLIASKSSSKHHWTDREIAAAAARAAHDQVRLIPVILDKNAEISPLLARYQYIPPSIARDPNRVADLIDKSLDETVAPPDLNREREIIETEQENLDALIASQESVVQRSWSALGWVLSLVGLVAGTVGVALFAVSADTSGEIAEVIAIAIALATSSLSAVLTFGGRSRK